MASLTTMLLGVTGTTFRPPTGTPREVKMANMDAAIEDEECSSFTELLAGKHKTTQDQLCRMAWAIRRTGEINNYEMMHALGIDTSRMKILWNIFINQGWVETERRTGARRLFYKQTALGKKMFAYTGEHDELNQAA